MVYKDSKIVKGRSDIRSALVGVLANSLGADRLSQDSLEEHSDESTEREHTHP